MRTRKLSKFDLVVLGALKETVSSIADQIQAHTRCLRLGLGDFPCRDCTACKVSDAALLLNIGLSKLLLEHRR